VLNFFKKTKTQKSPVQEWTEVGVWFVILISIRTFVAATYNVPSESMLPTIQVGDTMIATKYNYGYDKYSYPMDINFGSYFRKAPHRGDVIVFRFTKNPNITYVKRLIGLPGDHIQVINGNLLLNGIEVKDIQLSPYNIPYVNRNSSGVAVGKVEYHAGHIYKETLTQGVTYDIAKLDNIPSHYASILFANNTPEYVVPEGKYFFMGDDRDNSSDSRFLEDLGFVPQENLVGKVQFVLYSMEWNHPKYEFWYWPMEIRFNRFFHRIK